ncbi:AAA family ATPase [Embleya sp. NBC_00896]|uniref:ParA family protein n=1 Tax=Embleya sp. NBC_00896 TaxID=2975961 RepID=UPI002F90A4FE|nr:AAA family ATPase [Embleya sp. NBC_00896]
MYEPHTLPPEYWIYLPFQTIAYAHGKGGTGKSTLSSHHSAHSAQVFCREAAAQGVEPLRTLHIDLNKQGNSRQDFGIKGTALDDDGWNLYKAIIDGEPLVPIRDVRPGLDLVPGGKYLQKVVTNMPGLQNEEGARANLRLVCALLPIAHLYARIVIDTPPENLHLQSLAYPATRFVIVPTKADSASIDGLAEVAERYSVAVEMNPALTLLGVVLFDLERAAPKIEREARARIDFVLGGVVPTLKARVCHVPSAPIEARQRGKVTFELEEEILKRRRPGAQVETTPVERLAGDFRDVFAEIAVLTEAIRQEEEAA